MARSQKKSPSRSHAKPIRIKRRFLDAPTRAKEDAYYRVLDALAIARRENVSPTKASKRSGTTLKTMRKYAPGALEMRGGQQASRGSALHGEALVGMGSWCGCLTAFPRWIKTKIDGTMKIVTTTESVRPPMMTLASGA